MKPLVLAISTPARTLPLLHSDAARLEEECALFVACTNQAAEAGDFTFLNAVQEATASLAENAAFLQKRTQYSAEAAIHVPTTSHLSGMWDLMPQAKEPYGLVTPNMATLRELRGCV